MIKEIADIDISGLLECYYRLEPEIRWTEYGTRSKQAGIQYRKDGDPFSDAVGSAIAEDVTRFPWSGENFINPLFKDTVFEEVIREYDMRRTRLMWVMPFTCYSIHKDVGPRFHIPLITNPDCYFVFKESGLTHLSAGKIYWTDTRKLHTFINCSKEPRLHIVGSTPIIYV
jgi:hypothetical protein